MGFRGWGGVGLGVSCGSLGLCRCNLDSCLLSCTPLPPSQRNHTPPSSWKQIQIPLLGNSISASGLLLERPPVGGWPVPPCPHPYPMGRKRSPGEMGCCAWGLQGRNHTWARAGSAVIARGMNEPPREQPISPYSLSVIAENRL